MKIAVIAGELQKKELVLQDLTGNIDIIWINTPGNVPKDCHCCIDLLFEMETGRVKDLSVHPIPLIIINEVTNTLKGLPENFIRINGWPTFLNRGTIEASCLQVTLKEKAEEVFACFNKKVCWTPDSPGFVAARIVSSIINEAYLAWEEEVSTKAEIDTAMKLGTNYPFGPFEWCDRIGPKNVHRLLTTLSEENNRYTPAEELTKEITTL